MQPKMIRLCALVLWILASACGCAAQGADGLNVDDHQAYIDRRYPFIEQGSEPPGRFIDAPQTGGRKWSGESGWRTRHGLAVVWWDLGRPIKVEQALYPGNIRGGAESTLDRGWRRRAADGRRWILGAIAISPDDVAFTDREQPIYAPPQPAEVPNLEADLAHDAEFLNALQDDRFANAVYAVFQNRNFYKGQNQPSWSYGNRETARMIRDLRGLGESYQDWFPHGGLRGVYPDDRPEREASLRKDIDRFSQPLDFDKMVQSITAASQHPEVRKVIESQRAEFEKRRSQMEGQRIQSLEFAKTYLAALDENADVFKEIHNHLKRLGWRSENAQDREQSSRRRLAEEVSLLEELRALDRRPEANPGEWAEPLRRKDLAGPLRLVARSGTDESLSEAEKEVQNGGVRRILVQLAITGRISREEYDAFLAKLNKISS
jgi:hypothetical protein